MLTAGSQTGTASFAKYYAILCHEFLRIVDCFASKSKIQGSVISVIELKCKSFHTPYCVSDSVFKLSAQNEAF